MADLATIKKLLIVGAGATGSITASTIAEKASQYLPSLTIWDKGGGVGGRMTTRRSEFKHQVDMGAQYITRFNKHLPDTTRLIDDDSAKDDIFEELIGNNVLVPFNGRIEGESPVSSACISQNYVSLNGINSIPRFFINKSKATCHFHRQLKTVTIDQSTKLVECGWSQDGAEGKENFNCLLLTIPVPQLLALEGNLINSLQQSHIDSLKQVEYSSRYAMALGFEDPIPNLTWTGQYFKHPVIRYVCWDHLKRNLPPNDKPSLLIHTSVPFGLAHLEEDKSVVSSLIMKALSEVLPNLPVPCFSHLIRWRYSQVFKPYPGSPGCVILCNNPLIVCTGDAFTHSNLEGCITAANCTAHTVLDKLKPV